MKLLYGSASQSTCSMALLSNAFIILSYMRIICMVLAAVNCGTGKLTFS